jgi:hypothetical protein
MAALVPSATLDAHEWSARLLTREVQENKKILISLFPELL